MNKEPEPQTESELIDAFRKLLEHRDSSSFDKDAVAPKGACVYVGGDKIFCNVLTKAECDLFKGSWVEGGKCP